MMASSGTVFQGLWLASVVSGVCVFAHETARDLAYQRIR